MKTIDKVAAMIGVICLSFAIINLVDGRLINAILLTLFALANLVLADFGEEK